MPDFVAYDGRCFFSSANVMRLLEIVRGTATTGAVISAAKSLAKQLKKVRGDGE